MHDTSFALLVAAAMLVAVLLQPFPAAGLEVPVTHPQLRGVVPLPGCAVAVEEVVALACQTRIFPDREGLFLRGL